MDKKTERIIDIHNRLRDGKVISKTEEALSHNVNERTIQRDLDDIRSYYCDKSELGVELVYDRGKKGYLLTEKKENLSDKQRDFFRLQDIVGKSVNG